jgi:hypothetical protein
MGRSDSSTVSAKTVKRGHTLPENLHNYLPNQNGPIYRETSIFIRTVLGVLLMLLQSNLQ